ncbi:MAG: hypothetical protein AB200_03140 [Parcubacteria bacterium C7867-005]|nr:MAG: hypothetical protein AB200_03140 [Parcubacteria bacterium C7867-005]
MQSDKIRTNLVINRDFKQNIYQGLCKFNKIHQRFITAFYHMPNAKVLVSALVYG